MDSSSGSSSEPSSRTELETEVSERQDKMSSVFQEFSEKLVAMPTPEEKITLGLEFMRRAISQEGRAHFREFWEARRLVLPIFRENLNPAIRSRFWGEYVELTIEARRLKEILEEQSHFAIEQIDLAIQSIQDDLTHFEEILAATGDVVSPKDSETIAQKAHQYNQIQRELNLLNTSASRLSSLRKEIIKTDMRMRFKSKFFKRLSELGDQIFPKRKELVGLISDEFERDVDYFVTKHFVGDQVVGAPYYALREEIKALQGLAKIFTLSSRAFSRTRLNLSVCWDKVRVLEKEYKKVSLEKKRASTEQCQPIRTKIEELKTRSSQMALRDLDKEIEAIDQEMRALSLHREDVRTLQGELRKLRASLLNVQEQKARELEKAEREKLHLKHEKIAHLKELIAQLTKEGPQQKLELFTSLFEDISRGLEELDASKMEKQSLERQLRPLKDLFAEKKEMSLLSLSEDERKTLDNLRLVLQERKQRRQEIKNHLETCRKVLGSSGLDFEKAMHYRELIDQEKERLDKANASVQEIEQKIAELEG